MRIFDLSKHGYSTALIDDQGTSLSYRELDDIAAMIGGHLSSAGKNLLLVLAGNNIETVAGYLAALQSGNCVMLVDAGLDRPCIEELICNYRPDFIWGATEGGDSPVLRYGAYSLGRCARVTQSTIHPEVALLLSTSGSTGSTKFVRLSAKNVIANANSIASYLKLVETERPIAHLPIHYSYGLSVINSHLHVGAAIVLTQTPVTRREFWDLVVSTGCTSLAGVPYTFEMLKRIGFAKMDIPSLRYLTQAGGKMPREAVEEFTRVCTGKNLDLFIMYGATEATARISYLSPEYAASKPGSIGRAIPGGDIRLVDDSGGIVTRPHHKGELIYTGPNVMMGYAACRGDLAGGDELGGMLATGDLAFFDEEGYFYISGRKSRFVKVLGKRLGLSEIEEHLGRVGWRCICGGTDDILFVASHLDNHIEGKATFREIKKEICTKFKLPPDLIEVFTIENIPRSASGKIRYSEIFSANN